MVTFNGYRWSSNNWIQALHEAWTNFHHNCSIWWIFRCNNHIVFDHKSSSEWLVFLLGYFFESFRKLTFCICYVHSCWTSFYSWSDHKSSKFIILKFSSIRMACSHFGWRIAYPFIYTCSSISWFKWSFRTTSCVLWFISLIRTYFWFDSRKLVLLLSQMHESCRKFWLVSYLFLLNYLCSLIASESSSDFLWWNSNINFLECSTFKWRRADNFLQSLQILDWKHNQFSITYLHCYFNHIWLPRHNSCKRRYLHLLCHCSQCWWRWRREFFLCVGFSCANTFLNGFSYLCSKWSYIYYCFMGKSFWWWRNCNFRIFSLDESWIWVGLSWGLLRTCLLIQNYLFNARFLIQIQSCSNQLRRNRRVFSSFNLDLHCSCSFKSLKHWSAFKISFSNINQMDCSLIIRRSTSYWI